MWLTPAAALDPARELKLLPVTRQTLQQLSRFDQAKAAWQAEYLLPDGRLTEERQIVPALANLVVERRALSLCPPPGGAIGGGNPGIAGPAGIGGTLSGRLHVVLLLDGKLLFDRSITMPPTLVLSSETPAQAYSRILFAALDQVADGRQHGDDDRPGNGPHPHRHLAHFADARRGAEQIGRAHV